MTARVLESGLAGHRLAAAEFRVPQLATVDLAGWDVVESACYGKHLLLRIRKDDRAFTLHSHLRMDGTWRVFAPGEKWARRPAHTIRVVLRSPEAVAVGYHLHELSLVRTADERKLIGHLGPDLMGPGWDLLEAVRRLHNSADRPIAEALLDQRNLAGIGNLYKAEIPVRARHLAVDAGARGPRPGRPGRPWRSGRSTPTAAAGRKARPASLLKGEATFVYGRHGPAVPPLRHADPFGQQGRPDHLLVPAVPAAAGRITVSDGRRLRRLR